MARDGNEHLADKTKFIYTRVVYFLMNKVVNNAVDERDDLLRAEVLATGRVQQVGYRSIVLEVGRTRGLRGFVENLPDGTVTIIAEGPAGTLEEFVKDIDIRNGVIEVEGLEVDFRSATGEFRGFSVRVSNMGYEMFQGFGTAKRYFDMLAGKIDTGFESMGEKIDTGFESMGNKIDGGFDRTSQNFDRLEEKYHVVSDDLKGIRRAVERSLTIEEEKVGYSV